MVRSFADWDSERYLPKVIKSGIGPPVHILIFDFLRPSSKNAGSFFGSRSWYVEVYVKG